MAEGRRFFDIQLDQELAHALRTWDDKTFLMAQTWHNAGSMIQPLLDARMEMCAKQAQRIHDDIRVQMTTGELFIRMLRKHAEEHPVLKGDMAAEVIRQFSNICIQYYFWTSDDDPRKELLSAMMNEYQLAITASMGSIDDCGDCGPDNEGN